MDMKISSGDEIYFKILPDLEIYRGTVDSYNDNLISIKTAKNIKIKISTGSCILITHREKDFYADVESFQGGILKAKFLWSEKREYFRVDDYIPILIRKIENDDRCRKSKIFSGFGIKVQDELVPDESINPVLWKMLVDIQTKLGLILEMMNPDSQSLLKAESKHVNISAAGICLILDEELGLGDLVEIKMSLPNYPPTGILTYGRVVRSLKIGHGQYKTALAFHNIEDDIRDEIIQYTLKRQRDIMNKQRQKGSKMFD
ncbi:MAG: PilZ domain-containing protein [Thermodesulfovibrionales bacterium]|nr:PilZ domain-containing protein [Thermodesulfovibrionales bacterium]